LSDGSINPDEGGGIEKSIAALEPPGSGEAAIGAGSAGSGGKPGDVGGPAPAAVQAAANPANQNVTDRVALAARDIGSLSQRIVERGKPLAASPIEGAEAPPIRTHHVVSMDYVGTARTSTPHIDDLEKFIEFTGNNEKQGCADHRGREDLVKIDDYSDFPKVSIMDRTNYADCNGRMTESIVDRRDDSRLWPGSVPPNPGRRVSSRDEDQSEGTSFRRRVPGAAQRKGERCICQDSVRFDRDRWPDPGLPAEAPATPGWPSSTWKSGN
jgi:hypothetical protein